MHFWRSRLDASSCLRRGGVRAGFSLVEILLVCAILAAIAGMSWPAMRGVLSKGQLKQGADELQTTIRKARIQSVRSGIPAILRYEPGGRRYRVDAWSAMLLDPQSEAAQTATPTGDDVSPSQPVVPAPILKELPEGVRFASPESVEAFPPLQEVPPLDALQVTAADESLEPQWSFPLLFQTNGRSEDAEIRLENERGFSVSVSLRGLTGVVKATPPRRAPRPLPGESLDASADSAEAVNLSITGRLTGGAP